MPPDLLSASSTQSCAMPQYVLFFAAFVISVFAFPLMVYPQDAPVASEFDPGLIIRIIPGGRFTYDIYTERDKSEELEAGSWRIGGGASFRLKPIIKTFLDDLDTDKQHLLVMRLAYEYEHAAENEVTRVTNTLMSDITPRYRFPGRVLMSDRNRFELRWVEGDPSFRYRNRLRFERPIALFKKRFEPYVTGEVFWDSRFRSWNKFRYGMGMEIPLFKLPLLRQTMLDVFYERERCTTCPDPHTNIVGAKLNVFFKRNK